MSLRPIVISGPSGSGKSTLLNILFNTFKGAFGFSVSHTTRSPRPNEIDGKDYHFASREAMQKDIAEGKFLEHAEFSGNLYGTSRAAVQVFYGKQICILDVEEQGVRSIKDTDLDALYIFIKPPSLDILRERLLSRGTETMESIERRMDTALSAIQFSETPGIYDTIIINDDLNAAYQRLESFLTEHIPTLEEFRGPR